MTEANPAKNLTIGVIGAGVMGGVLIKGMLDAGLIPKSNLFASVHSEKSKRRVGEAFGIRVEIGYPAAWIAQTDVFLVCVKPPRVGAVLRQLAESGKLKADALTISIAAAVTIETMERDLPGAAVIRAMPNTPCRIGAGATAIVPGTRAGARELDVARAIFGSVGMCLELSERHLDAVTAVSGSGPAYGFLIMEALADGAVKVGLPREVAFQLVSQSMLGAALMMQRTGRHPAMLKDEVTTPSGCTISALLALEDGGIRSTLARAVEAAARSAASLA